MKKRWLIVLGVLLLIAACAVLWFAMSGREAPSTQTGEFGPSSSAVTTTTATQPNTADQPTPYVSPVDFEALQNINADVYGWIEFSGARVSAPIVQHPTDSSFYIDHDSDRKANINGAIFSEALYNSIKFDDRVTVLYGHNMKSGAMFGRLQSLYWDETYLREHDDITVYLPDRELHFEVFAALPYSRMHLLHYYHTEKQRPFDLLIDDIYTSRHLNAVTLEERRPEFGDQVIVLSTCLSGDNRYRYLVLGVRKGAFSDS